jgi:hypothetical protein
MKQLHPAFTKRMGLLAIKRMSLLIIVIIYSGAAVSQTLNFNAPTLESGTANQPGSVYRFSNLTAGERNLEPIILPVNLLSFTAQLVNEKVWLAWSTSQEENVSHYNIERSYDNKTFEQAALLFAVEDPGTVNTYSYKDPIKNVTGSLIYYRLKMIDKDGKYKYSEVKTIRIGAANDSAKVAVYPNPVVNELYISLPQAWQNKTINAQLLNSAGSIIKTFNIQQAVTIVMSDVPEGTYYLKVVNGNEISTQTILKSKN